MSYIAAGYAVALATLGAYAGFLIRRRRRLESLAARSAGDGGAARS
ncbi:MAG TPA: hypothetical protein VMU09_10050 [Acidimicrobiales bacterium]|nr:hypothetical protein [Acidimicrobiales bacterium]